MSLAIAVVGDSAVVGASLGDDLLPTKPAALISSGPPSVVATPNSPEQLIIIYGEYKIRRKRLFYFTSKRIAQLKGEKSMC